MRHQTPPEACAQGLPAAYHIVERGVEARHTPPASDDGVRLDRHCSMPKKAVSDPVEECCSP
jgi:hypothetical protein